MYELGHQEQRSKDHGHHRGRARAANLERNRGEGNSCRVVSVATAAMGLEP